MTVLVDRAAAGPLLVGTARLWVAAILLLLAASVTSGPIAVAADDRWRCIAMGACMAVYQAAYFTAVTLSGIAIAALVAICSAPLVIAALAPWLLRERPAVRAPGGPPPGVPRAAPPPAAPHGPPALSAPVVRG